MTEAVETFTKVPKYFEKYAEQIYGLFAIQAICHGRAAANGWWTNIKTGEAIDPMDVNVFGLKISLMHSELSEALEGFRKDRNDDHLPHRKAVEVELADAIIRILDTAGAMGLDIGGALFEKLEYNDNRPDHKKENRLLDDGKQF